jgi:Na+-translocating ferredoxin:NAD+ oxidoreductase RnfD subunit
MSDTTLTTYESPPPDEPAVELAFPAAPLSAPHPTLLHSGMSVPRYFALHVTGVLFPVTAAVALYGWRGIVVIAAVVVSATFAMEFWRRIGARGQDLRFSHTLWLALLLALMLPVHLGTLGAPVEGWPTLWPLLPASAFFLVFFTWLLGGVGSSRVHPAVITYLLLVILFHHALVPHWVLQRGSAFRGDPLNAAVVEHSTARPPWIEAPRAGDVGSDAIWVEPASQRLIFFTSGTEMPERTWLSLESLLRDRMPPLEDLIIGGLPGPIGVSSAIAVIMGGLFLLYRGLIDFRIPLLIVAGALVGFLVLPIPVVITEAAPQWRWLAWREPGVGWATALTFANYEILAGPLLFMAFFLATASGVRPMARRARFIYALLIGVLAAGFQLYASVSFGPYLAMLVLSLLTPTLDKLFAPRPLV